MAKVNTRVTFRNAETIALLKAANNAALTDMGNQALQDASMYVPVDQGTLKSNGISSSDKRAVDGKMTLRWNTPYARYLWHGDVMYGNPTNRTYGPKKISFTAAMAHEEWAKYAREVYGEEWRQVYQASLRRHLE